jgi:CHAT domain-containing protein
MPPQFEGELRQKPWEIIARVPVFVTYSRDLAAWAASLTGKGQPSTARGLLEKVLAITARQIEVDSQLNREHRNEAVLEARRIASRYLVDTLWSIYRAPSQASPAAARQELVSRAFELTQWAASSEAGDALVRSGAKIIASNRGASALLQARDGLEAHAIAIEKEETGAGAQTGSESLETRLRDRDMSRALDNELFRNSEQLRALVPEYWDLIDPTVLPLSEIEGLDRPTTSASADSSAGLLRADEATIAVLQSRESGIHVFAASQQAVAWSKAPISSTELDDLVGKLRCSVDPEACFRKADGSGATRHFDRRAAYEVYRSLFADPAIARVVTPAKTLIIVSKGALTSRPLGMLVTESPTGDDSNSVDLRDTHWLVKDKVIAVLPSVPSLRSIRRLVSGAKGSSSEPFLGFAPSFHTVPASGSSGAARGAATDPRLGSAALFSALRDLPDLSNGTEVDAVRALLNAPAGSVYKGDAATKSRLLELNNNGRLGRTRVIDFATHALLPDDFGIGEPALVLAPPSPLPQEDLPGSSWLLRASDVATLHFGADWVLLSACDTGSGATHGAEELSGLARAFMFVGARSLLVSHWSVRDDAAVLLVTKSIAYQRGAEYMSRAQALRQAELDLINAGTSGDGPVSASSRQGPASDQAPYADPAVWAPFVVIGTD